MIVLVISTLLPSVEAVEPLVVFSPPLTLIVRPWNRNLCSLPSSVGTTLLSLPIGAIVAEPDAGALTVKL